MAGSEITTNGLERALLKHEKVSSVYRLAPQKYEAIDGRNIDLLIIEGWHVSLDRLIEQVRRQSPSVKILFWNLSFFGFNRAVGLNVDAFLSNSKKVTSLLAKIKPTRFVMLAADTTIFKPQPPVAHYQHEVVYLGMFHPNKSEEVVQRILYGSTGFDLAIYGSGWQDHAVLGKYWNGKLPIDDIPALYNSAKVVLGTTEDRQRKAGMINNRVFEALACGANLVCEHSDELELIFGDEIFLSKHKSDTITHLEQILSQPYGMNPNREKRAELIHKEHGYESRVLQILDLYGSL